MSFFPSLHLVWVWDSEGIWEWDEHLEVLYGSRLY